jgi:hypothetical protein
MMTKRELATFNLVVAALRLFQRDELGEHILAILPEFVEQSKGVGAAAVVRAKLEQALDAVDKALLAASQLPDQSE